MTILEPKPSQNRVVVDLTMTVDEARKVTWQGRGSREPIGILLDKNELDYRDLAWAVESAYKPEVRAAARTLLSAWLGKPETIEITHRFGPNVVEGSHYLEDKWLKSFGMLGVAVGMGITMVGGLVGFFIQGLMQNPGWWVVATTFVGAIIGLGSLSFLAKREFDKFLAYRRGHLGEEKIVERLRSALDSKWTIYRNLNLPGRREDIDIVLVGPGGVWAVEVKAYRASTRFKGSVWEQQNKLGWKRMSENPFRQVSQNAQRLNRSLQEHGIVRWVEPAVAISEPQPISNFDSSDIPIWLLPKIEEQVAALTTRTHPTEKEIEQINLLLKSLAEKQLAREEAQQK